MSVRLGRIRYSIVTFTLALWKPWTLDMASVQVEVMVVVGVMVDGSGAVVITATGFVWSSPTTRSIVSVAYCCANHAAADAAADAAAGSP